MKNLSAARHVGLLVLAVAALLALGVLGATAATPPKKPTAAHCPKPKAGKKAPAKCAGKTPAKPATTATTAKGATSSPADQLCRLGQAWVDGHYRKPVCKANPIFAKDVCATFVPAFKALDPSAAINDGYFPSWSGTEVACWYIVNGRKQGLGININASTPAAFAQGEQIVAGDGGNCPYPSEAYMRAHPDGGPPSQPAVNTTIDGYTAWTWDPCADQQPDAPGYGHLLILHHLGVLAGTADIDVQWDGPYVDLTTAQMMPLVQKLIDIYKTK
jgi:hypothetical protein